MPIFVGIDLTSSSKRPSGVAKSSDGEWDVCTLSSDEAIVKYCEDAITVAIDSPLALPNGFCCLEHNCGCGNVPVNGRSCERELARIGIPLYFTTKNSIIKHMIYRAMGLTNLIGRERVIEIYPYATKVRLFGKPIPKKTTKEGLQALKSLMHKYIRIPLDAYNHDECDAILACYTAQLWAKNKAEEIGAKEESPIVIPKQEVYK